MRAAIKRLLLRAAARLGYQVRIRRRGMPQLLWDQDEAFLAALREVLPRSLVDEERCHILWQLAHQACALPGRLAEVGVYQGGTAKLLAHVALPRGKALHLFDTFTGMPATDPTRDIHVEGQFADTSLAAVRSFVGGSPLIHFHPGRFPETAGPLTNCQFCLVHVDVDIYQSVRDCCEFFYPRLVPGAFLIFDDYGFASCPGARMAVDEFFTGKAERPLYLSTG